MSSRQTTFEVRVEVVKKGTERYRPIGYCGNERIKINRNYWLNVAEKIVKMFHIDARTHTQALRKAEKHGRPLTVRKVDKCAIFGDIEKLQLNQSVNPYENAIAMDEFIWHKKHKRHNRLLSKAKTKDGID